MNIQNLNTQELEQLQTLLNKMNPTTTSTIPDIDPVEEMIEDIMENFDWARVQLVMHYLGWRWVSEYVTIEMLKKEAERLLRGAIESRLVEFQDVHHESGVINATGGLEAEAWCDESKTKIVALDLKFVLASWDQSIEE